MSNERAYYNEVDPYAAQWLRNLIAAGHIASGDVDERSIVDVSADDIREYQQCHWFAGIGGWSLALRIAGWGDDRAVWTGSPPCQDNSVIAAIHGRRSGFEGSRSGLARTWLDLIEGCRPSAILFENVPGVAPWLSEITGRLASVGYCVSVSERSSADIGAPHPRRRVWAFADRGCEGFSSARQSQSSAPICDPRAAPPGDGWAPDICGYRPVDDGLSTRTPRVRAYGNAIDPWVAAKFISSTEKMRANVGPMSITHTIEVERPR